MRRLDLGRGVFLVILVVSLAIGLAWKLLTAPQSMTINTFGVFFLAWGIQGAVITAILWLRTVKGPGRLGTDPSILAGFAIMGLARLVPDSGEMPADTAIDLGMIVLMLIGIIVINLGQAWTKPDETALTNLSGTGTSA